MPLSRARLGQGSLPIIDGCPPSGNTEISCDGLGGYFDVELPV
jgi:hypothetical protein